MLSASYANFYPDNLAEKVGVSEGTTFRSSTEGTGIFLSMADKVPIEQNTVDSTGTKEVQ